MRIKILFRLFSAALIVFLVSLTSFAFDKNECIEALVRIAASTASISTRSIGMKRSELVSTLRGMPQYQWIADDLMAERVSFATNQSPERRELIAKTGFKNIFETGKSDALNDPMARVEVEAGYAGIKTQDYDRLVPQAMRPKYGYLAPLIGSHLKRESEVQGFGEDVYIFKKERLRDRTTWIIGDSLDQDDSRYRSTTGRLRSLPKLNQFHLWKDRDLLLPRLGKLQNAKPQDLALQDNDVWVTFPNGNRVWYGNAVEHSYIELQYWGLVSLDDVESFIYTKSPPTGVFLRELQKRGIKIYFYDGKQDNVLEISPKK